MYEGFTIATQNILYLLLEENLGLIDGLSFPFRIFKFGSPNDEALGSHLMTKYGLSFYGIFEVINSPWIEELKISNRIHPSHHDSMFKDYKHYIITYKDNTLEVVSNEMTEIELSKDDLINIVSEQINYIKKR